MLPFFAALPLAGKVTTVIAAVAVVVLLAFVLLLKVQVSSLESDVKKKNEEIGQLQVEKAQLKTSIQHQNEAIDTWKNQGVALQSLLDKAVMTNQTIATASMVRQQHIVQAKVPQDCPGAMRWLADEYNKTVTRWNDKGRRR